MLLSAAWAERTLRQHRQQELFRQSAYIEAGLSVASEIARVDLMRWLKDEQVVSFDGAMMGRSGVSGLMRDASEIVWMESSGTVAFPANEGFEINWSYRIEDLNLNHSMATPEPWDSIDEQWLAGLLRGKSNRALLDEPLPDWVNSSRPLLLGWRLDAAVYATPLGEQTANCAIRLRFYLDLDLWNPWEIPVPLSAVNEGSRWPVWRWVIEGMPEVNLINHSLGVETGFQALDYAYNEARPREERIAAWVERPGVVGEMEAGARWTLTEPNVRLQPQGLARLLHRSFPVRPADRLELRVRFPSSGLNFSLAPYDTARPPQSQNAAAVFWRFDGIPAEDFSLHFDRADRLPNPVYRPGLSQDFRRHNTQIRFEFRIDPERINAWIYGADPRRVYWPWDSSLWPDSPWTAADVYLFDQQAIQRGAAMPAVTGLEAKALFRPVNIPLVSYRDWQMLPTDWGGGPGLGHPIAEADQSILNRSWFDSGVNSRYIWMPINALAYEAWEEVMDSFESVADPHDWWLDYIDRRFADGAVFNSVEELSQSGLLMDPKELPDPSQILLADSILWARHGRVFAIHLEAHLHKADGAQVLQRRELSRILALKAEGASRWIR